VVRELTALDNVALAVQALQGHSFRFWRRARLDRTLRGPADAVASMSFARPEMLIRADDVRFPPYSDRTADAVYVGFVPNKDNWSSRISPPTLCAHSTGLIGPVGVIGAGHIYL
jgi:hypothetical protein